MQPLLEAVGITKSFAGVRALKSASLELRPGEVHAVVGENGAGKSTLIRIFSGAIQPDGGTLRLAGREIANNSPAFSRMMGVSVIYQQPALFPHLTIAENIGLALEQGGLWRRIRWRERVERARLLLERAGSDLDPERLAGTLSMPEQQVVEIARAIGADARIVIMDEPTASLTEREVERLFAVIASLRAGGAGIIYISHRLEEVASVADRVTVLRDGETIGTRVRGEFERADLIRMMVGRELSSVFPKREVAIGDVALELRDVSSSAAGVSNISLSLRRGEILGLAGLVGAGRTELARVLFGIEPVDSGAILLNGREVRFAEPAEAIAAGIAYVPEDRRQHGVILPMPLTANTTLASLSAVSRNGLLDFDAEREITAGYVRQLGVKTSGVYREAGTLSGGNQQKIALARWLMTKPSVLILDEPTQGVDVGSKSEIHTLMGDLAAEGIAILMISSELPEILGMSDRVAVMHEGSVAGILSREQATPDNVMALALGHEVAA